MIVILSSSSWSPLLQNELSRFLERIDMTKDDITLQLGERWAQALKNILVTETRPKKSPALLTLKSEQRAVG